MKNIISIALDLLTLVASPTLKIFHLFALEVEVRKQYDLLFVELTKLLRHYHVGMRVLVVQFDDVVVFPEF